MISTDRRQVCLLRAVTVLIAVAIGPFAGAQGPGGRDVFVRQAAPPFLVNESQVDHWAFGGLEADEFRGRLERRLKARINEINRICPLTEAQRNKLDLAGRVEIRRFFADVEHLKQSIRDNPIEQPLAGNVFPGPPPPQALARKNLFTDDSFLGKVLRNSVGNEQFARYERVKLEQRVARHQATLNWVVGTLDISLHLNAEQNRRFAALLAAETRPPRKFGEYDYYGVMFQLSRLPETKLKAIFDPGQWAKLRTHLAEASRLQPTLEEGGFVPENGVAAKAPVPERKQAVIQPEDDQGS